MAQTQNVPGASQAAFNTLSDQIGALNFSAYTNSLGSWDYNSASSSNNTSIPNGTVLIRARFWYDGNSDPYGIYANALKNMPKYIIQSIYCTSASNDRLLATIDVNWKTNKVTIPKYTLPNNNYHIGIQFYGMPT